jgi:hypothetical protein
VAFLAVRRFPQAFVPNPLISEMHALAGVPACSPERPVSVNLEASLLHPRWRSALDIARVVLGGALVAASVLAGPAGHDLLRVVLPDLGQECGRAAAAHRRHGAAPM